jgi:hypothetical protein
MTVSQHQKLGRAIKDTERAIREALTGNHYRITAKETKALHKALRVLSDTRCAMDDAVFREHPALTTHELIGFYYGQDSVAVFP